MTYESDRSKSRIIWFCSRSGPIEKHVMARNSRLTALDSLRGFGILLVSGNQISLALVETITARWLCGLQEEWRPH